MVGLLRRIVLTIDQDEVTFRRRGFRAASPDVRERLEHIGATFLHGYHTALADGDLNAIGEVLDRVELDFKGFAFEGASMALGLLDGLSVPRGNRLGAFADGPAAAHRYMVYVGAGWALARMPWSISRWLTRSDPLLRWLVLDGYGFHEGYFHWERFGDGKSVSRRVTGYGRRAFDQGLGRSLWFVDGADVSAIARAIGSFDAERQDDLWSGVGLAACYANGVDTSDLERLVASAGEHWRHLAQGAAFAIAARLLAANTTPSAERACQAICGVPGSRAGALVVAERPAVSTLDDGTAYEEWRTRIRTGLCRLTWRPPGPRTSYLRQPARSTCCEEA